MIIKSFHEAIVTNGATSNTTSWSIGGGTNAAPSAAVVSTELAALAAAGYTITHN